MPDIVPMLKGVDLSSIGRSETVVKIVLHDPSLTKTLVEAERKALDKALLASTSERSRVKKIDFIA